MSTVGILIILVVLAILLVMGWLVVTYNRLVRHRTRVHAAWAQIDVQLKRRHALIPNLVETVKGYTTHERSTLEAVVAARSVAVDAASAGSQQRIMAEGALTKALGQLFALAEAYPTLKASENFLALQGELAGTEDKLAYARQFYNNAVQTYDAEIQTVPTNIVAGLGGFTAWPFFEAAEDDHADVNIRF